MPVFRPGKPYALFRLSVDTALGAGAVVIPFNVHETDGAFTSGPTGGSVTVEIPGLYLAVVSIRLTTGNTTEASVFVNGARRATGAFTTVANASHLDQLEAGDVVTFQTSHSVARTAQAGPTNAALVRIGPKRWT